jgi:hypothetical protein
MSLESITGSAIALQFFSSYGDYLGREGRIVGYIDSIIPGSTDVFGILGLAMVIILMWTFLSWRRDQPFLSQATIPFFICLFISSFMLTSFSAMILVYLAVFGFFIGFLYESRSAQNPDRKKQLISVIIFGLIGWAFFGSTAGGIAFLIVGLGCALFIEFVIAKTLRGSGAGRKLASKEGLDVGAEEKIMSQLNHLEHLAKNGGILGSVMKEEIEVMKMNDAEEIQLAVQGAGAKEIAELMIELDSNSLNAEKRDIQCLEFARKVTEHIKQDSTYPMEDEQRTKVLRQDLTKLVEQLKVWVDDAKFSDHYRKKTFAAIQSTEKIMSEAGLHANNILKSEIMDESSFRIQANQEIDLLRSEIKQTESKLSRIRTKDAKQANDLKLQIDMMNKALIDCGNLKQKIFSVAKKGQQILGIMKSDAEKIVYHEKKSGDLSVKMRIQENHINQVTQQLNQIFVKFEHSIRSLDNNDLPEKVLVEGINNMEEFFKCIKELTERLSEMNEKELRPFISETGAILQDTYHLENAEHFAAEVSLYITDAEKSVAKMVESIGNKSEVHIAQDMERVDAFEKQIATYADRKAKQLTATIKKSYGDLSDAIKSIDEQISYLKRERAEIDMVESAELSAFRSALDKLTEIRKRQFAQFTRAANTAQSDLNAAVNKEKQEQSQERKVT